MGSGGGSAPLKDQLRALRRPAVLVGLLTTLFGYGGIISGIGLLLAMSSLWLDRVAPPQQFHRHAPLAHRR